jgi:endoglycosylceramidase
MRWIASECAARGLYVIVDIHQDGYSRYLSRGSGDGFPAWAISPKARLHVPDNGPGAKDWPIRMATDPGMHRSFADFYSDTNGVRTRYLLMLASVARGFADVPGVIGYDPLNEPWGHERTELAPLYADAERVIRAEDPAAILFIEGRVTTNIGLQTRLPRPSFGNVAYSPHYYKPSAIIRCGWKGHTTMIDLAFLHMRTTADAWDCPLFLGEFGVPATADRGLDYIDYLYDRLDDDLSSGAQWNYTPGWTDRDKDGWNGEDFTVLSPSGQIRPNFRPRPYPRRVAGDPIAFRYEANTIEFTWCARPERGETEVFVPCAMLLPGSRLEVTPRDATFRYDQTRQVLLIQTNRTGTVTLRIRGR